MPKLMSQLLKNKVSLQTTRSGSAGRLRATPGLRVRRTAC